MRNTIIKIYVVLFGEAEVPDNKLLYPIQAGSALATYRIPDVLHDDTGDNISAKNKNYCELTAIYWAWKNDTADYYGFFHYRRYFVFNPMHLNEDGWGSVVYASLNQAALEEMKLDEELMRSLISQYDVITVKGRNINEPTPGACHTIYSLYGSNQYQHPKDLDKAINILLRKYPKYYNAVSEYLGSSIAYECNMFIMNKKEFRRYCEWLFDILFELEKELDIRQYNEQEIRAVGFIGERLFGIYYTYLKKNTGLKLMELQKAVFLNTIPQYKIKPVYRGNAVPVTIASNNRFVPYLSVMLQSIINHASESQNYDLIILHHDIPKESQEFVKKQSEGRSNISIRFVDVKRYFEGQSFYISEHLSIETYYRLALLDLMPDYKKILYLDVDMVVNTDIAQLYDFDLGESVLAAVKDIDIAGQLKTFPGVEEYIKNKVGLVDPYDYFQAGTLVIDLKKMSEITSTQELLKIASCNEWQHHDQDIMNHVCKGKVTFLPQEWNVLINWINNDLHTQRIDILKLAPAELYREYMQARNNPKIIHYAGYQKPWNYCKCDLAVYFWECARNSPFYESILVDLIVKKKPENNKESDIHQFKENIVCSIPEAPPVIEELKEFADNKEDNITQSGEGTVCSSSEGIIIEGLNEELYRNSLFLRFVNKMNKLFPIGTKRRNCLKKIAGVWLK